MALPGFTADVSVGPTAEPYRAQTQFGSGVAGDLVDQQSDSDSDGDDLDLHEGDLAGEGVEDEGMDEWSDVSDEDDDEMDTGFAGVGDTENDTTVGEEM